jgi:hypothetical protein
MAAIERNTRRLVPFPAVIVITSACENGLLLGVGDGVDQCDDLQPLPGTQQS